MAGKPCALFGAYGWGPKAVADMKEEVTKGGAKNVETLNM